MKLASIPFAAALFLFAGFAVSNAGEQEITRVYYPNEKEVEFTVDIPSAWKMIPQGEEGAEEFFEVEGPNGLELSFRTVPGADIEKAIEAHIAYLKENFTEVKPLETKETKINGLEAILLPARAKDEDGKQREIGAGWFKISDDKIGELWYNVDESDEAGIKAAITVLNSLAGGKK